jgi:Zn-dependent peptidase ImmA (M78 family)
VVAHEAGTYPPAPDTLEKIGEVLGFPLEFFYGDDLELPSLDTGSFRSMSKMTAAQREMALSQAALGLHLNHWLETRFELPKAELPDLSRETNSEAAAESLRRAWGLGALSIRNMIHLLESKGVRVFSLAVDAKEVDAFSMWKGATPFVFLNTHKSSEHSRFDAAHELGHLVLHKHGPPQGREAEQQANSFASCFLMPRGSVFAHKPSYPAYPTIVRLKRVWTTSVSAVSYRLHELGLISDWQYRGLCIEIAKRGRHIEPDQAPRETSQILQKALVLLYSEGMNRAKIAQALCIPTSELEQLLFGLAMTGIEGGKRSTTGTAPTQLQRVK